MRSGVLVAVLAIGGAIAAIGFGYVRMQNELIAIDVATQSQWKQVANQLERQYDLLPKLAAVARTYAGHEKEILDNLMASRERYVNSDAAVQAKLAGQVDGALVEVLSLAERYPTLRADQHYRDLAYEIAGTKNRIAVERQRYNELVGELNTRLRQFPWRLAAGDLEPREYYEPPTESLVEPELTL